MVCDRTTPEAMAAVKQLQDNLAAVVVHCRELCLSSAGR